MIIMIRIAMIRAVINPNGVKICRSPSFADLIVIVRLPVIDKKTNNAMIVAISFQLSMRRSIIVNTLPNPEQHHR
jgi:hypothetical protein